MAHTDFPVQWGEDLCQQGSNSPSPTNGCAEPPPVACLDGDWHFSGGADQRPFASWNIWCSNASALVTSQEQSWVNQKSSERSVRQWRPCTSMQSITCGRVQYLRQHRSHFLVTANLWLQNQWQRCWYWWDHFSLAWWFCEFLGQSTKPHVQPHKFQTPQKNKQACSEKEECLFWSNKWETLQGHCIHLLNADSQNWVTNLLRTRFECTFLRNWDLVVSTLIK